MRKLVIQATFENLKAITIIIFSVAFQLGLCERELHHVLYGQKQVENKQPTKVVSAGAREVLKQKLIEKEDVCPICQDDIYKTKKSLTYCKYAISLLFK